MSTATGTIRYDGPILADHRMDVADLAPALLGLSELCKIANAKFNGERAFVKVLIATNVEHQCFQVDLHVVQSLWDQAKSVLNNDDVGSAKNLLEWLGLIGGGGSAAAGTVLGVFQFLKWLRGRKIRSAEPATHEGHNVVRVTAEGDPDNGVLVHLQAIVLARDEAALRNAKKVIQLVLQPGYEKLEFQAKGGDVERIEKPEAEAMLRTSGGDIDVSSERCPQTITAWIRVYSPVYDLDAKTWRFKLGTAHQCMDISATDIAARAMERGGAMIDDAFRVELQITQALEPCGSITTHYKIKKVLDFRPAPLPYERREYAATQLSDLH
jgi:hypothetical protein